MISTFVNLHVRSGLNITWTSVDNASLERFITGDPIEEDTKHVRSESGGALMMVPVSEHLSQLVDTEWCGEQRNLRYRLFFQRDAASAYNTSFWSAAIL